ncbi:MAG: formylglycine-generating enzyme family protein [Deltaproteobacteria bacterium]|nr:formylglycine-generating enzyme family protein [Deltaproteobacteria bacterium]
MRVSREVNPENRAPAFRWHAATVLFLMAAAGLGCERTAPGPTGQVVVYLDTDAPVGARGSSSPDDGSPQPLFDRVSVEIFAAGATTPCDECTRELVADASLMRENRFSFGVIPVPREVGIRARLRLFRSAERSTPRPQSTIELVGYLPAVAEEGVSEVTAVFRTDDVGSPRGSLQTPIIFERGAPSASLVGTWPGAQVIPCVGQAPQGAVCVPGGAFFMGEPRVNLDQGLSGQREHLVVISPYFLDAKEVTVGQFRASGFAHLDTYGHATDPLDDSNEVLGSVCDYTSKPGANEGLPVMCVSWQLARLYCESKGGHLPTEAQYEYVASRRGSSLFPWGDRDPACSEAVVARRLSVDAGGCSTADPLSTAPIYAEPAGSGTLDRVHLAAGDVFDLGANVSEWALDFYQGDDGPCWASSLLKDPLCTYNTGPDPDARSVRGGNLATVPVQYVQVRRVMYGGDIGVVYEDTGFRCAYPAGS